MPECRAQPAVLVYIAAKPNFDELKRRIRLWMDTTRPDSELVWGILALSDRVSFLRCFDLFLNAGLHVEDVLVSMSNLDKGMVDELMSRAQERRVRFHILD